jgi:Concanavalin A-like lectin/glucanases superfamily
MKRPPTHTRSKRAAKVACTVSAAALMLGVSQAATVGLHFQVNYCADPRYTGFPVALTAFGVSSNAWENLTEMTTGYGCSGGCSFMNLSQVVATNISGGGLNPLPNGLLTINWGGSSANFSGFGGYGAFPIYGKYAYDGPPPGTTGAPPGPIPTGEFSIYSSFIRDGVNFGPVPPGCSGPANGDNDQPGYSVDIVGLQSLFTNTPFVVQLIASSDSMQSLTNAFIIDASLLSTQSVTYPNTSFPPENEGGSPWFRGHGGGLSTVSGPLTTDHLQIIGNRAAHGTSGGANGFDNASTISGFILTDKPVISMSPQPVIVGPGDTITWNPYAIGVPPLAYQWLKNGTPIPGATTLAYSLTNVSPANLGNYALRVTNLYGSATSSVVKVDQILPAKGTNFVIDTNPAGPEHDGVDFGATWLSSFTDSNGKKRTGVMSFNGLDPDQITVPAAASFNTTNGTIMFWMLSAGNTNSLPAALFDRDNQSGLGVQLADNGAIQVDGAVLFETVNTVADTNWHHIALVYDQSNGIATCYIDGVVDPNTPVGLAAFSWPAAQEIELGLSHDTNDYSGYTGLMDDFRQYNRVLTAAEVASVYSSDALVDTNALVLQLNFTTSPAAGVTLSWQETDVTLQSAPTVHGPWTDVGVAGATQYRVATKNAEQFFRYHGHQSITIVSNPYLM